MAISLWQADYGKSGLVNAVDVGQVIDGKYKLLRLLGDGGMGAVYEAQHLALGTHIAIKVLHPELTRKAGLIERFLQEARVSAQIRSPHVVQVTDFAQSQPTGTAYLVMELLQGEPLSSVVRRERKLSVPIATEYTLQILQALEAAHALDVIHRDLKPDNVFVTFEGGKSVIKLIDFGIAKLKRASAPGTKNLTVAGTLMGTPEYMAPEQAYSADKVDVRADLYSVGVMLYEMLSGQTPATGEDPRVVILKIERGEVTPLVHIAPEVKPELAGFVHRAMAPKPELRFSTATEMRLALEALLAGKRIPTSQLANGNVTAKLGSDAPPPVKLASERPVTQAKPATPATDAPGGQPAEPRGAIGTGTVMGAPAVAALAPDPMAQPPGTGTVRAAPIGGGGPPPNASTMGPNMMGGHGMAAGPYEPTRPPERRQKSGNGLIIALAIVALLFGAGAVVAYMASTGAFDASTPTPQPTFTPTTPVVTTPATTTAQVPTQVTPVTPVTPLTPGPVTPPIQPTQPTAPTARVDAGAAPPRTDAGTAPSGQPHPFPPFPSAFPSAFPLPSAFPSAFPLPSGFPPIFPPPQ